MGGVVFFVKKWTFPTTQGKLCTVSVFLFYILLFLLGAYIWAYGPKDFRNVDLHSRYRPVVHAVCT